MTRTLATNPMFNEAPSAVEAQRTAQVVSHISARIEDGSLQPGDKLPPEREFAKTLQISRTSLRTAIGYLAGMGILKVRHGVGAFVADCPSLTSQPSFRNLGALLGFNSAQMLEVRLLLEPNLAALAAQRGKQGHFTILAEELLEMHAAFDDPALYLIHDARFHRAIAEAADNPLLMALMDTISTALCDDREKTASSYQYRKNSLDAHREIYRAIRRCNPGEARAAMERHLNSNAENPAVEHKASSIPAKRRERTLASAPG
ncbi:MAG: FadR/GntR family transcriptional regulator [Terracidiphilus sp.]|jgi:GntR family transcriptional repressor for pyruvate dehydrogenase complex